jgi:hypothetical protein
VNELVTGVGIALGAADLSRCLALDLDGDQLISISELIRAVGSALNGCS